MLLDNPAALAIFGILAVLALIFRNQAPGQHESDWLDESSRKNRNRFEYMNAPIIEASKARRDKEERDRREAERLERYRKNREGMPPTYEEWKAARQAEQPRQEE